MTLGGAERGDTGLEGAEKSAAPRPFAEWTLALIGAGSLMAMMCLTFIDVVGRYFFNMPLLGGYEITALGLALVVFSALPLVTREEAHIRVSLFESVISIVLKNLQGLLANGFCALVSGLIAWRLYLIGIDFHESHGMTSFLRLPMAPLAFFIAAASGFASFLHLRLSWNYAQALLTARKGEASRP